MNLLELFFIEIGFIIGQTALKRKLDRGNAPLQAIVSFVLLILFASLHSVSMEGNSTLTDWVIIFVTGTAGFIFILNLSKYINSGNSIFKKVLVYIGNNTFYILTFHFLMMKPTSLLKIIIYHLDWQKIACYPIIEDYQNTVWLFLYFVVSVIFSLGAGYLCEKTKYLSLNWLILNNK